MSSLIFSENVAARIAELGLSVGQIGFIHCGQCEANVLAPHHRLPGDMTCPHDDELIMEAEYQLGFVPEMCAVCSQLYLPQLGEHHKCV